MYSLIEIGIVNALTAAALALVLLLVGRYVRRPAVLHAMWILVLLKLVTPPLVEIPFGLRVENIASLVQGEPEARKAAVHPEAAGTSRGTPAGRDDSVVFRDPNPAGEGLPEEEGSESDVRLTVGARPTPVPRHSVVSKFAPSADVEGATSMWGRRGSVESTMLETGSRGGVESAEADASPVGHSAIVAAGGASDEMRGLPGVLILLAIGTWLAGTLVWFARQGVRVVRFHRFVSTARPAPVFIQRQAESLARTMGMADAPDVCLLPATISPMLWAIGSKAKILFPEELLDRMDEDSRATLLAHELAHYFRRDHWVRLFEFVVGGLFWWNPAVWLAKREIEVAEEECCDAWVVELFPEQPRRYAQALLDTIDFLSNSEARVPAGATGIGNVPFLRRRLTAILCGVAPRAMSGTTRLGVLTLAAVLLPLGPAIFGTALERAEAAISSARMIQEPPLGPLASVTLDAVDGATDGDGDKPVAREAVHPLWTDDLLVPTVSEPAHEWGRASSVDGRFQVVAKTDRSLTLTDAESGRSFDLTDYGISTVAFSPARNGLIAGGSASGLRLLECDTGRLIATLNAGECDIRSVTFSPEGLQVAGGAQDGRVVIWNVETQREVESLSGRGVPVSCLRFSPDGRVLALTRGNWLAPGEGSVSLIDVASRRLLKEFTTESACGALAFSADGLLFAAQWNGRVTVRNPTSGELLNSGVVVKEVVSTAAFSPRNQNRLIEAAEQAFESQALERAKRELLPLDERVRNLRASSEAPLTSR